MLLELASSFANRFATKGYGIFENGNEKLPINDRDLANRRQVCFRFRLHRNSIFKKIFLQNFSIKISLK